MSMRVIEEKQRLMETNDGDWKKEMEDRLHECHTQVYDMMVDVYGIPMDEEWYKDNFDGLMKRVEVLEEKLKRLDSSVSC